ncbi:MAG: rhodanese-like domain-containing protein [Firmicutes bacterium]|nr:rhodanese-like domain-containing protein [Bacillota bacterium]MDY2719763.1 rhodanese-like domain-containing protein [Candidatus Faecousia sp.]
MKKGREHPMKFILILLTALLLGGCAAQPTSPSDKAAYRQISMEEAVTMMAQESDYIILDVRRADEFASGHIPGAINVANESIGTAEIPELPDKNQLILVYCRSGNRSKQASQKLADLGYTNIVEFGGIIDWPGDIEK